MGRGALFTFFLSTVIPVGVAPVKAIHRRDDGGVGMNVVVERVVVQLDGDFDTTFRAI